MKLSFPKMSLPPVNWFGLIAGALMLALPFMGPWWRGIAGTGAMEVELSPFDFSASFLGQPLSSSLIWLFLLGAKIAMIIAGAFMVLGSLFVKRWWSRRLVRFGMMKPFWMIISLMALLLLGAFIFNNVLPGLISGMAGEAAGGAGGGLQTNINIPYVSGTATSTIQMGNATITAPVTLSLTGVFWVAVFVAVLGIVARIYQWGLTKKFAP